MRNYILLLPLLLAHFGFAQVGIGTTTPTAGYNLDIKGDLLVQKDFNIGSLENVKAQDGDFKFLFRLLNSSPVGEVAKLNMGKIDVGPINIANYKFTGLSRDNLEDVNLNYDATKYIVGIADIRYIGAPVRKIRNSNNEWTMMGYFVSRTFISGGTWHLEIRNPLRDNSSGSVSYEVTLIVYDRKYFRELSVIEVDFDNNTTGSAPAPSGL